jgi:antitoxin HicB
VFYPVTLTKDSNGTFFVRFRDVPEAVTFGDTKEEALEHAVDALLSAFDAFMRERRDIPAPSDSKSKIGVDVPALDASKVALYQAMRERRVNKSELARRLQWHLPQVDRVLQVRHGSQLEQLEAAFAAVGKRLRIVVTDREPDVPGAVIARAKGRAEMGRHVGRHVVGRSTVRRASKKR